MMVFADTSPTIIKQTYRFKTLPDDGSYSLIISNISGDLIVSGHEGSGALINVEKITFGIKKKDIPNIHKKETITVNHLEDQNQINIIGDSISKVDFMQTSIELSLPKHFKVISPFKFSPIISPPEARHEIVFPSISFRVIEPPLL